MVVQTVASLRKSCKKMGITGYSTLKKAQLMRKCGSPKKKSQKKKSQKKKSQKKKSSKKYPSLPQFTPPPIPKSLPQFTPPAMPKKSLPQFTAPAMPKKSLPQFTPPAMPKKDLGSKVPWVFPDPKDSPPSYDSLYGDDDDMAFGFRGVQRRCSKKRVSKCHRRSRICSKNTSRIRCRLSASKRRSHARASSRRSYRKHH